MRTCPTCGGPLAGHEVPPPVEGPADRGQPNEPELLGLDPVGAGVPESTDTVRRPGVSPRWLVAAAVVMVVLGVGMWAVGRAGSADPAGNGTAERGEASTPVDQQASGPGPSVGDSFGSRGQPEPTDGVRVTEETEAWNGTVEGPVFAGPVGWALLFGSPWTGSGAVRSLDLDAGIDISLSVDGAPVLVHGDRLILAVGVDSPEPALRIVPLADPSAGGPEVPMGQAANSILFGRPVLPGPDADTIWLHAADAGRVAWRQIRLSDGETVRELGAGESVVTFPVPGGGPYVVTSPGGGVYGLRGDGDDYRFVASGQPLAASGGDVLVESCTSPTECVRRWVDVASGAAVDRPVPPEDGTSWLYVLPGGDRYLYGQRYESSVRAIGVIFDLEQGRLIESGHRAAGGAASSPDGRIIAVHTDTGMDLYDVEQDRWVTVPRGNVGSLSLVFVANGAASRPDG